MSLIKIYTTNWCSFCVMAKRYFDEQEMPYEEINIEEEGMRREALQKVPGGMSVPQIIIDDEVIGGYDNLMEMASAGELPV